MKRLKKLIKTFRFTNSVRSRMTLSAEVSLDSNLHHLTMRRTSPRGPFPTTGDAIAKTWLAKPETVKGWIGFFVDVRHGTDDCGQVVTNVRYRLSDDGSLERYWDGTQWRPAEADEWNTEEEVATNIGAFPVKSRSLQVILNLSTTDADVAPQIGLVKVLYDSDVEFQEDLVLRSLIPLMEEQIRPIAEYDLDVGSDATTVNLGQIETPYTITGVDSAYNLARDVHQLVDIAASFDSATKLVTLSDTVQAGERVRVRFFYRPVVALTTDQDYTEIASLPAVVIDDVARVNSAELHGEDAVINKATGQGWKLPRPQHNDLDLPIRILTDSAKDQTRLADEMNRFFRSNELLRSRGLDEDYRLWLIDEYDQQTIPNQEGVHSGALRARIVKAVFYSRDAVQVTGVLRFRVTGGNMTVEVTP